MNRVKTAFKLLKETFSEWKDDNASRLAAALAYYTIFSLAPLLLIVIALVGVIFDEQTVKNEILKQASGMLGAKGSDALATMIDGVYHSGSGVIATIVGVVTLLLGAAGVFGQLQNALNTIWDVTTKPGRGILQTLRARLLTFALIPVIGFLLLVSLIIDAALSLMKNYFTDLLPAGISVTLLQLLSIAVSFAVITLLFALIYKMLPDVKITWRDVIIGAVFTALLFTFGRFLIGLYIGRSSATSAYGAAGSLIVILLWIYYSAQIVFFGAEFTQVYARWRGSEIVPDKDAIWLSGEERLKAGRTAVTTTQAAHLTADAGRSTHPVAVHKDAPMHGVRKRYTNVAILTLLGFVAGAVAGFFGDKGGGSSA